MQGSKDRKDSFFIVFLFPRGKRFSTFWMSRHLSMLTGRKSIEMNIRLVFAPAVLLSFGA